MAVVTTFLANQQKAIVQGEALANELEATGYAVIRDLLATHTLLNPTRWIAAMLSACADARLAWTDRELADGDWIHNNADVRAVVDDANRWRAEAGQVLAYALAAQLPGAEHAAAQLDGIGAAVDAYEQQRAELPLLVRRMERLDGAALGLSAAFVQEGQRLALLMSAERRDADAAKGTRAVETSDLGECILRIAGLAEQLHAARSLAAIRARQDLPGFDLTYIRAAAAAHRPPAPVAAPVEVSIGL